MITLSNHSIIISKLNRLNDILLNSFLPNSVAQLRGRENQPDRMTMIAIADGNQVRSKVINYFSISYKMLYSINYYTYSIYQTI